MSEHPCYMCGDTGIQGPEQGVTFGGGTCYCEAGKAVQAKADSNLNNGCTCGSRSDSHRQSCKLFVDHLKIAQLLNRDALKVVEQFLPNIGKCFGVDMQLLNETLIGLRKQ